MQGNLVGSGGFRGDSGGFGKGKVSWFHGV